MQATTGQSGKLNLNHIELTSRLGECELQSSEPTRLGDSGGGKTKSMLCALPTTVKDSG
jgi:hypothetical protein